MIKLFKIKRHPHYSSYVELLKARSGKQKFWALFNYLLPGMAVALLINVDFIHESFTSLFNILLGEYQFWVLILLTFGWHLAYPIYIC